MILNNIFLLKGGVNTELLQNFVDNPMKKLFNTLIWPAKWYFMKNCN